MGDVPSVALYRKYRGLSFSDIVGQEHITSVLEKAIRDDRISHAYLFTGPRGVGKTSIARIMAHRINDLDYKTEDNHIDIIEIDAASNRRIDEIRDLREKAYIAPVSARYKVYIIDEVHMLTKEAFNALLKTLEEPPAHVVFILATTEAHKLPQTIISRTQRHTFKPMHEESALTYLESIAKKENINIDAEALQLVVRYGDGSFRDAVGLLDQVASLDTSSIDAAAVRNVLGLGNQSDVDELLMAVRSGDRSKTMQKLQSILSGGIQPEILADQLIDSQQVHESYLQHLSLVEHLIEVPSHSRPAHKLEIVLLQHASQQNSDTPQAVAKPREEPKPIKPQAPPVTQQATKIASPKQEPSTASKPATQEITEETPNTQPVINGEPMDAKIWQDVVKRIKTENNPIASILRNAETKHDSGILHIGVKFGFHKKKLEASDVKSLVQDALLAATGESMTIECYVAEATKPAKVDSPKEPEVEEDVADRIISTFGGGERVNL